MIWQHYNVYSFKNSYITGIAIVSVLLTKIKPAMYVVNYNFIVTSYNEP